MAGNTRSPGRRDTRFHDYTLWRVNTIAVTRLAAHCCLILQPILIEIMEAESKLILAVCSLNGLPLLL